MPAIINAPSSAWFVLRDLAEGSDPKAPFYRPSPVGNVPTAAEIRGFYESLGPATGKLTMARFDPSTYPLGEGWADRPSPNEWEAAVSAAELLNSDWSIGDGLSGALVTLTALGSDMFNPVFAGGIAFTPPDFFSGTMGRTLTRYNNLNGATLIPRVTFTPLDPLVDYNYWDDRPYFATIGRQSRDNPFEAIGAKSTGDTTTGKTTNLLITLMWPDREIRRGYAAPINWWAAFLTPEIAANAQLYCAASSTFLTDPLRSQATWLNLTTQTPSLHRSDIAQARRILTSRWHEYDQDVRYILDAMATIDAILGGNTKFATTRSEPTDSQVLDLISTMGIYPALIAVPFDIRYKIASTAKRLRERQPEAIDKATAVAKKVSVIAAIISVINPFPSSAGTLLMAVGALLTSAWLEDIADDIESMFGEVADLLFLAADPQAALNDTVGYILAAVLTFFRRTTGLVSHMPIDTIQRFNELLVALSIEKSLGVSTPTADDLCQSTFGLTEVQMEQMIRSLGSASNQSLNSSIARLSDDDWGYAVRMDRLLTESVLSSPNFNRSDLITPVYCIDPDLLGLPFTSSFSPLVHVSRWIMPGGRKTPMDRLGPHRMAFDSKDDVATASELETALTDPTLQLVQTINLASLLLECGFEAEGFTGLLSRFMASNGSLGYYLRDLVGKRIGYTDVNVMLDGFSISSVIRFIWRQMITDEFVAYFAQNHRNVLNFSDVRGNDEWLWTVIPWMSTLARRRLIQQVMGALDFANTSNTTVTKDGNILRTYAERRIFISESLPEGSILYRLSGGVPQGSTASPVPGTAFERFQDLPTEDRDAFRLFMAEMAKCDQEVIALAKLWKGLRASPDTPSPIRGGWGTSDFDPTIEPADPSSTPLSPDRAGSRPFTPIALDQLIGMAYSMSPAGSKA